MLKTRVIPTVLWRNENTVKGKGFDSWRNVGVLLPTIKVYNLRQVDELIVLDIIATKENRQPDLNTVSEFAKECFVPLTVGGGIKSVSDVKGLLRAGADKICLNTQAVKDPSLVTKIANSFGSQCVVVSIDAKKVGGEYLVTTNSGSCVTKKTVHDWAREAELLGAGEIMITSIEKDGTMEGYDLDLVSEVTRSVSIPVIASGGAGKYEHFKQVISKCAVSAVAASAMFIFTEATPRSAKLYLSEQGVKVRL